MQTIIFVFATLLVTAVLSIIEKYHLPNYMSTREIEEKEYILLDEQLEFYPNGEFVHERVDKLVTENPDQITRQQYEKLVNDIYQEMCGEKDQLCPDVKPYNLIKRRLLIKVKVTN